MSLPSGTVTFLLTDVEGSTQIWEQHTQWMSAALNRHDALALQTVQQFEGVVVKSRGEGDSLFCVFARATDAVQAALVLQRAFVAEDRADGIRLRVRMALHTGEAELRDDDYYGGAVNRCARLRAIGHGGQVLLSEATTALVRDFLPPATGLRDCGEQRLRDLARPEHVFQLVHPDLPADFPALKSLDTLLNNLPRQLTSFIGREKELGDVRRQLAGNCLLTLTGSGGCGKSRLALQVAADVLEDFPDGVWLAELGSISDGSLVPQAVGEALGVREASGQGLVQSLVNKLRGSRLLLLLDNCEHLLMACAQLADALLRFCPGVKILASSREALGVVGEAVYRIPSLALPNPNHRHSIATLSQFDAVRLFVERAVAVSPKFAVTNENAPAVAQICHRLDGIPLALELAAARVRAMPPEQIAQRLDDRFRLLTGGSRTALPRQQTLRALIDWSYDLLNEPEKLLLARLSVFAGGWSLEAAEAVCAGDPIEEWEVLGLLMEIVDKSLVVYDQDDHGHGRYRLLETVRQYARERLDAAGAGEEQTGERHMRFFLGAAQSAQASQTRTDEAGWMSRLDDDIDNLRTALLWCIVHDRTDDEFRLFATLCPFWFARGYIIEASQQITHLLSRAEMGSEVAQREKLLQAAGEAAALRGDQQAAWGFRSERLAILREIGNETAIRWAIFELGTAAHNQCDYAAARSLFEECLALFQADDDQAGISFATQWLAGIALSEGNYESAWGLYQRSLSGYRALRLRWSVAWLTLPICTLAVRMGDLSVARRYLQEGLAVFQEYGDRMGYMMAIERAAGLAAATGRPWQAARLFGASDRLRQEMQSQLISSDRKDYFDHDVAVTRDALDAESFEAAWSEGRALSPEQAVAEALAL